MKRLSFMRAADEAFTLIELLLVIAIVAILAAIVLRTDSGHGRAWTVSCMNNLKQIGYASVMFAQDTDGHFPSQVSVTNGGSLELVSLGSPALHFQILSNYITHRWYVFHCPADASKQALATTNNVLTEHNLSYFVSVDATPGITNAILAGDRNLELAGKPLAPGLFTLTTNTPLGWTTELHGKRTNQKHGNILFTDAHVQFLRADLLARAVRHQAPATNRLAFP